MFRSDCACHFETVVRENIRRAATSRRVIGYGNDHPIPGDIRKMLFEFPSLNAEIHGKSSIRGNLVRPSNIDQKNLIRSCEELIEFDAGEHLRFRGRGFPRCPGSSWQVSLLRPDCGDSEKSYQN